MFSADDAAESAKAISLLIQTLLKVRESLSRKPSLDPDLDKFLELVSEMLTKQADLNGRIIGVIERDTDHMSEVLKIIEGLNGQVAHLTEKVAQLEG